MKNTKQKKASKILVNRNAILDEIRKDRKEYQSKRLKIEGEKIEIQKQKVKEIKRRNDFLAERNDLIKTLTEGGESSFTSLLYGNLKNGTMDIKSHKWFKEMDFLAIFNRMIDAPFKPSIVSVQDTSNFDSYEELPLTVSKHMLYEEEFTMF
ncbi:unnamed protein product [Psylliodes chrysocephalus]|uniref:AGC-kinase C-terminal domain-containing protein n=1 Tax=Psylliodes chrysocephalus TaxID=3402493 RepID=A0A9P0GH36_9CUCU|nr:unnamed protein product [Psylliodes chrysocephala]